MLPRNLINLSYKITKYYKTISQQTVNYSFPAAYSSVKPVNLSFMKIHPDQASSLSPIIILHGFLGSKQNWRSLAKAIAKKSGRQVYALDARNHGDSPHLDHFSYDLMCEDLKHFMHSQSIQTAVLIGHSMGGRTAMKLALTEKQMVDKLVVVDVSPISLPESSSADIAAYLVAMKEAVTLNNNSSLVQARKSVDDFLARTISDIGVRQFLLTNLIEKDGKIVWKPNIDVLQKTFHSEIRKSNFSGYYIGETLFICGGNSPYVSDEDNPRIKELFPKAEFVIIPEAGHWVHSEKPSEFLETLCNFL